jgi:integrase
MAKPSLLDISKSTHRKHLKPRREPYWRAVAKGRAVGVRITAGGQHWIARLRHDDGRKQYEALTGAHDYDSAERLARQWFDKLAAGVVHGATVEDAARAYVEALRKERGEAPAKEAEQRMKRRVYGTPFGSIKLEDLRQADVEAWREALADSGLSRATVNRELAILKAMLTRAWSKGLVDNPNVWKRVARLSGASRAREDYLTLEQRRAFLRAAEGAAVGRLIEAMMHTGARPVELTRATVADFDKESRTLTLISYKGRGGVARPRVVPLGAAAFVFFKKMVQGKLPAAPLLTRDDGKPWQHSDHDHLVREARDRAGLPATVTLYSIRHSVITDLLTSGLDVATVSKITGTGIDMIQRNYSKLVVEHARSALAGVVLA